MKIQSFKAFFQGGLKWQERSLRIPLSRVDYYADGMGFQWDRAHLIIPYQKVSLSIKPVSAALLEEFKSGLSGDLVVKLRCRRFDLEVDIGEIKIDLDPSHAQIIEDVVSRVGRMVSEIQSLAAGGSLTIEKARAILQKDGRSIEDFKIRKILAEILNPSWVQNQVEQISLPLSGLVFVPGGILLPFKDARLEVPQDLLPFKVDPDLSEIKAFLKGELTVDVELTSLPKWDPERHAIGADEVFRKVIRVSSSPKTNQNIEQVLQRWKKTVGSLMSMAESESLTWERAQELFRENGFTDEGGLDHQILEKIVNRLPIGQRTERYSVPLSELSYQPDKVLVPVGNGRIEIPLNQFPFEVGSILEEIKAALPGQAEISLRFATFYKWSSEGRKLLVGKEIGEAGLELNSQSLENLKQLRFKRVSEAVGRLISVQALKIEDVAVILQKWGLGLNHPEMGGQLSAQIPAWKEEEDFQVPLKTIAYKDDEILAPLVGTTLRIPAGQLPFKPRTQYEIYKRVFCDVLKIHAFHTYRLIWDEDKRLLTKKKINSWECALTVDKEALKQFEKIEALYVRLLTKMDSFKAVEYLERIAGIESAPKLDYAALKDYDVECIHYLENMAEKVYATNEDIWFVIQGRLVWERPEVGSATYLFRLPGEDLNYFIGKIWASERLDIRQDPQSGYIGRVIHAPDDRTRWERNINAMLRRAAR